MSVLSFLSAVWALSVLRTTGFQDLVFFNTSAGFELLKVASHSQPYLQLASHFATEHPGMCGPTTAAMILNSLSSQGLQAPESTMYSATYPLLNTTVVERYWDPSTIWNASDASCPRLPKQLQGFASKTQPWKGTLLQIAALLTCHGTQVSAVRASRSSAKEFRAALVEAFSSEQLKYVSVNFDRVTMGQRGDGHHSPIAAYDAASDRILVLDVARYKYAPWWASVEDMFAAMNASDTLPYATPRGYLVVGMRRAEATTLPADLLV
eukprot:CAMPEP_0115084184 /NCGR_PEP_ID=MMETSP0227-20121206/21077_1 /TAXON_ID=89957 /ORGANISM="Polarella glacialis, Strain CCMP 1383" /LENGTH=265 /DNA_ID=CAMNT_0002472879 /DNA_START=58 /DNA_END=855 /DNA_ORIENTATION=+